MLYKMLTLRSDFREANAMSKDCRCEQLTIEAINQDQRLPSLVEKPDTNSPVDQWWVI